LTFCQKFQHPDAHITVVDRTNHHLFQPLLYQVATAGLSAPEIAQPIRSILSDKPNVTVLLDQVLEFDLAVRRVTLEKNSLRYDYLVLALGGCTGYFGHPEWEQFAPASSRWKTRSASGRASCSPLKRQSAKTIRRSCND
jgi:NADH dehydrogenase